MSGFLHNVHDCRSIAFLRSTLNVQWQAIEVMGMAEAQQDQQASKTTAAHEQTDHSTSYTPRQIFREHALQQYIQKNEKTVLPKTISPFVFTCCWIALALSMLAGFLIWSIPVPNYLDTIGMPTLQGSSTNTAYTKNILVFFPLSAQAYIKPGQIVQVSGNNIDSTVVGHIMHVDPRHLNKTALEKQDAFRPELVQFLPSTEIFVGTITISQAIPAQNDTSNRVVVRYQQGTRQAISLLMDLSS
jgi:hypothetical protein